MIKIRHNVFETNSSSTHSITFVNEDKLNQFINGESFFNTYYDEKYGDKNELSEFPTREQVRDYILNKTLKYNKLVDDSQADKKELQDVAWVLEWFAVEVPGSRMSNMVSDYVTTRNDDGTWSTRKDYQKVEDVNYFVDVVMNHVGGPSGQFISYDKAYFVRISQNLANHAKNFSRGRVNSDEDFFDDDDDSVDEEIESVARERNINMYELIGLLIQYYNG